MISCEQNVNTLIILTKDLLKRILLPCRAAPRGARGTLRTGYRREPAEEPTRRARGGSTRGGADEASTRGIAGEERQLSTSFSKSDEQANETTSHPTGESTSTYRSDGSKVRTAPERGITRPVISFERRVRSWLRMNAGGAPNTCKSNGTPSSEGKRVANG